MTLTSRENPDPCPKCGGDVCVDRPPPVAPSLYEREQRAALRHAEAVCRAHGLDVLPAETVAFLHAELARLERARSDTETGLAIVCEVRDAVGHFVDDDETAADVSTVELVLRALDDLSRAESELELAQTWGAELVKDVDALVGARDAERAADRAVLVALVVRAAREIPDRLARHALLADLLADHPDALDGLSGPELERLRGRP